MTAEKISLDIDIFSEVFLYLYTRKPTLYMDIYVLDLMGSNCTFMELKFGCDTSWLVQKQRSNCTFMELKYLFKIFDITCKIVLIVPLWN